MRYVVGPRRVVLILLAAAILVFTSAPVFAGESRASSAVNSLTQKLGNASKTIGQKVEAATTAVNNATKSITKALNAASSSVRDWVDDTWLPSANKAYDSNPVTKHIADRPVSTVVVASAFYPGGGAAGQAIAWAGRGTAVADYLTDQKVTSSLDETVRGWYGR